MESSVTLPSVQVLASVSPTEDKTWKSFSAFADPATAPFLRLNPLPSARDEAEAFAKFFKSENVNIKAGAQATKSSVRATSPSLLLFAAHGLDGLPSIGVDEPFIALSPEPSLEDNGMLSASEISGIDFKDTRLAILSACDSGRVLRVRMGAFGPLVQAFLASGVRTILATQPVDSKAAHDLMAGFAEQAIGNGKSVNAALRESVRRLRADAEYAHPYFWAPFVYVGVAR